MEIFHCPMDIDEVSIRYKINAGALYERHNYGLAHFVEHILYKGTKKRKDRAEIHNEFSKTSNHFLGTDFKNVHLMFNCEKENLEKAIELTSDCLFNPLLRSKDIEDEKSIILNEIALMNDGGDMIELFRHLFEGTRLAMPIIGLEQTVNNIDPDEIREFHKNHYGPGNMGLAIVGGVSETELQNALMQHLLPLEKSAVQTYEPFELPKNKKRDIFINKNRENHFVLSSRIFNCDILYRNILEGILNKKLTEDLLYKYHTSYLRSASLSVIGEKTVLSTKASSNKDDVGLVKSLIEKNIMEMQHGKFSEEDVREIKKKLIRNFKAQVKNPLNLASYMLHSWPNENYEFSWLDNYAKNLSAIDFKKVLNVANIHFRTDDLTTLVL